MSKEKIKLHFSIEIDSFPISEFIADDVDKDYRITTEKLPYFILGKWQKKHNHPFAVKQSEQKSAKNRHYKFIKKFITYRGLMNLKTFRMAVETVKE